VQENFEKGGAITRNLVAGCWVRKLLGGTGEVYKGWGESKTFLKYLRTGFERGSEGRGSGGKIQMPDFVLRKRKRRLA